MRALWFIIFMKQEPEAIIRIKQLTSTTLSNLKAELAKSCGKLDYSIYAVMFCDCMNSLEAVINNILTELGTQYSDMSHTTTALDAALLSLKQENKHVQEKLDDALKLIALKELRIQDLEGTNETLTNNILVLQQVISAVHNQNGESSSVDSLENLDLSELEVYISDSSSNGSEVQQMLQLDEGL